MVRKNLRCLAMSVDEIAKGLNGLEGVPPALFLLCLQYPDSFLKVSVGHGFYELINPVSLLSSGVSHAAHQLRPR